MNIINKALYILIAYTLFSAYGFAANLKNLAGVPFPERAYVIKETKQFLAKIKPDDAYQLSMPLIASAQLGENRLYQITQKKFAIALAKKEANTLTAWLYGRMLLAAKSIGNEADEKAALTSLNELLQVTENNKDCFRAWTLAYLAANDDSAYQSNKVAMESAAMRLTTEFFAAKKGTTISDTDLQALRSNALWAWIMGANAAASASDKTMYHHALSNILTIMDTPSLANALTQGLLRNSASNDYPAWGIAIIELAAARLHDGSLFNQLAPAYRASLRGAMRAKASGEIILAITNHQLAATIQ